MADDYRRTPPPVSVPIRRPNIQPPPTPPPAQIEYAEPPQATITPHRTHVNLDLKTALIVAGALIGGGWMAARSYIDLTNRVQQLTDQMALVAMKADITRLSTEVRDVLQGRIDGTELECPNPKKLKGDMMRCRLVTVGRTRR